MSPTLLAWTGAGRPAVDDCEIVPGRCYWCGAGLDPLRSAPISWLPDSFPAHKDASVKTSDRICEPCCWSMGQRNALPRSYALDRIARKADVGRRGDVVIDGETEPRKVLILKLADGRVGLWSIGKNAAQEEGWAKRAAELREAPVDVGPCAYLGSWPLESLSPAPTDRMQSYHHFATSSRWWPCTDTDRGAIREWLLHPPDEPWVGAISDGKKHGLPFTAVSPARSAGLQVVYHDGDVVTYDPVVLHLLLGAIEALIVAGARDEEIASGRYHAASADLLRVRRQHDAILSRYRGGALLLLAFRLRRNRKELEHGT